jgi:hypothetical protein
VGCDYIRLSLHDEKNEVRGHIKDRKMVETNRMPYECNFMAMVHMSIGKSMIEFLSDGE